MTAPRRALPLCLALATFGWATAAAAYAELPRELAGLTPAQFAERVRVRDEPSEPHILVSTRKAWQRGRSLEGAHAKDVHLRALVDKQTGAVRWQVWHDLVHDGRARTLVGVSYLVDGKPAEASLIGSEHWESDCPPVDAMQRACNSHARLVFELPGQVVAEIAALYSPDRRDPWRLHFRDEAGGTITGGLAPAEAAGLLEVVERVRRDRLAARG